MGTADSPGLQLHGSRKLAFILANGAYTQKAPLSKTVSTATDLQRKLITMGFNVTCAIDQDLSGMRSATYRWLQLVDAAADAIDISAEAESGPLLVMFVYCGHGGAGRFFPIDAPKRPSPEESYCFFEDFLLKLYDVLSFNCRLRQDCQQVGARRGGDSAWQWRQWPVQVLSIIESCRRLSKVEQLEYEQQRARIASGRRHLLPCMASLRPDLAPMGGAEWDAARLAFLSQLGANSPQLLLALSSESTTPSYDVVYLRSIVEQIDKPVRFVGILERASLDTLRRTGHKQKPVLLLFGDQTDSGRRDSQSRLHDLVLGTSSAGSLPLRRSSSASAISDAEYCRAQLNCKDGYMHGLNSRKRISLPVLV